MQSQSTSTTTPSFPFNRPAMNKALYLTQRDQTRSTITPFSELTADSTLKTLVSSASIAQECKVNNVFVYALVFDAEGKMLLLPQSKDATRSWCAPRMHLTCALNVAQGKLRISEVVGRMASKYSVEVDEKSSYLVKAVLPEAEEGAVVVAVRLDVKGGGVQRGAWANRAQVERLGENEIKPEGLKGLMVEAFGQREFEADVLRLE